MAGRGLQIEGSVAIVAGAVRGLGIAHCLDANRARVAIADVEWCPNTGAPRIVG